MADKLARALKEAAGAFQVGVERRAEGENEEARKSFLMASEKLFQAAKLSSGSLKETRLRLAQKLFQEAQELNKTPGKRPSRPLSGPGRVSAGDEDEDTWLVRERPDVSFDDIAGLEDVKEQIRIKLLYPFTHPELAEKYNVQPGGGLLLYGPPGTGKTLIARAVAGEIEAAFFTIKPSEVMSQWVGKAEKNLARLFAQASSYPVSVIFIDEMESLAPKRRVTHSTVMKRVVPQLLAELQGFHERENILLLIGATNEPWEIDSAVLRPGRLDRLIYVPPPDPPARRRILELNLKSAPLTEEVDLNVIAALTEGYSGADMVALARRVQERVFLEAVNQGLERPVTMADFKTELNEMGPSIPVKDLQKFEEFTH